MSDRLRIHRQSTSIASSPQTSGMFDPVQPKAEPVTAIAPRVVSPAVNPVEVTPETEQPATKIQPLLYGLQGHSLSRMTIRPKLNVSQSENPAQQATDSTVEPTFRSQPATQIQTKSIQSLRGFDFSKVFMRRPPEQENSSDCLSPLIQPRLTISQPNDPYEQEADRVADQVMRMQIPESNEALIMRSLGGTIHRKRAAYEGEIQAKSVDGAIYRKPIVMRSSDENSHTNDTLESQINSSKGGGSLLPDDVRSFMEPRFGFDFSQVRIHTGIAAEQMNRKVNAQAFTYGQDIYFGSGKYTPDSSQGKQLLAHELTHVIQQTGGVQTKPLSNQVMRDYLDGGVDNEEAGGDGSNDGGALPGGIPDDGQATGSDPAASSGTAPTSRKLDFVTMKRKHIDIGASDKYGHWWTEIDGQESYGWWPKYRVGLKETLFGCEGELNGITTFRGTPTTDPHHGDSAPDTFNPVLTNSKTDAQVRSDIRSFVSSYSGEWRWTFGWGQNCHTFQESLMSTVGLTQPSK